MDSTLRPFESLVYDQDLNSQYNAGDVLILGPTPDPNTILSIDPHIKYRDANNNGVWDAAPGGSPTPETIFYDVDNTTAHRITLIGTPTVSTSLIKTDASVRFVDANGNHVLDGVIRITGRLENAGGPGGGDPQGYQEDVDAIQISYNYDPSLLKVMRTNYESSSSDTLLPDRGIYSSTVDTYCNNSGTGSRPLDRVAVDEQAGTVQSAHACLQGPPRDIDVGIGCDPATRNMTLSGTCIGDGSGGPLQNLDAFNLQFMITGIGAFTFSQVVDSSTLSPSQIHDIDSLSDTLLPVTLVNTAFDNRLITDQPPTANFTFTPVKPLVSQTVSFDASSSIDPDGTIQSYQWTFGDQGSQNGVNATHTYANPGNFSITLTVRDNAGLTGTISKTITVNPVVQNNPPVAVFTFTPGNPLTGQMVTFNATLSYDPDPGDRVTSYSWSFGDATYSSQGPITTHLYNSPGTYSVLLDVVDNHGAHGSTNRGVFVTRIPYQAGVRVGDWAKYTAVRNMGGVQGIILTTLNVTSVSGSNITFTGTTTFPNGTSITSQLSIDVQTSPFGLFFIAANLTAGDPPFIAAPFPINTTVSGIFSGATRQANQWGGTQLNTISNIEWDQESGIPLTANETIDTKLVSRTVLVDTNIWNTTMNRPPVPIFDWTPISPIAGQTITFNATLSFDPDADQITGYNWNFGDGQSLNTTTPITNHAYSANGTYTVTLTLEDRHGAFGALALTVGVGIVNQPPTAMFTFTPAKPAVGQAVNFDGRASTDPDGTIVSWQWNFGNGAIATGPTVSYTYQISGSFTVTLTVTDNGGATNALSRLLTVNPADQPPVARISVSFTSGIVGLPVLFNGTSSFDPDGRIVSYHWDFDDGSFAFNTTVNHAYRSAGIFNVTLTVTDNALLAASSSKTIIITFNLPPVASFSFSPTAIVVGHTVSFDASASSDRDDTIVSYHWEFGDEAAETDTTAGTIHTYTSPGIFTASLIVIDNRNAPSELTLETISVYAMVGLEVVVNTPEGKPIAGAVVSVTGLPTGQGPLPDLTTGSNGSVVFRNLLPGNYTYQVTVTGYDKATKTVKLDYTTMLNTVTRDITNPAPTIQGAPSFDYRYVAIAGVAAGAVLLVVARLMLQRRKQRMHGQIK